MPSMPSGPKRAKIEHNSLAPPCHPTTKTKIPRLPACTTIAEEEDRAPPFRSRAATREIPAAAALRGFAQRRLWRQRGKGEAGEREGRPPVLGVPVRRGAAARGGVRLLPH
jgi:hypothetical protein